MQFQQDYPQPCPQRYPQQYPMVIYMQTAAHDVGEIWGDIAEQEKYGQRMVCMSCVSGFIWLFMFEILWMLLGVHERRNTVFCQAFFFCLGALVSCGPAICAVAVKKGCKGLLRCFCCCSSLVMLLHLFMLLIYASALIYIWRLRQLPPSCGFEQCGAAAEAAEFDGVRLDLLTWPTAKAVELDCFAPALWPGYVQASASQWSAEIEQGNGGDGAERAEHRDALASTIISQQKQYPAADTCPCVFAFLKCNFEKVPPFLKGVPTSQQVFDNCVLDDDVVELYSCLLSGWWAPGLLSVGTFVHSTMFLLFCCGCRAGRKLRKRDDGGIELAMLQR